MSKSLRISATRAVALSFRASKELAKSYCRIGRQKPPWLFVVGYHASWQSKKDGYQQRARRGRMTGKHKRDFGKLGENDPFRPVSVQNDIGTFSFRVWGLGFRV